MSRCGVAWLDGGKDVQCTSQPEPASLGWKQTGPLPQCCNSPRLHCTHRGLYQRPLAFFQVRTADPLCQAFPAAFCLPLSSFHCRASLYIQYRACHTTAPFCQPDPRSAAVPPRRCFALGSQTQRLVNARLRLEAIHSNQLQNHRLANARRTI